MSKSATFGKCPLCPSGSKPRRLLGVGVCPYHMQHPEDDHSKIKAEKPEKTEPTDAELSAWFRTQVMQRPERCENGCGRKLVSSEDWRLRAMVCHILPKRTFHSVAVHPLNRWFGCGDCHTLFDRSWSDAQAMPVWGLCVERFKEFMGDIRLGEIKYLPDQLQEILNKNG